jgi:hypothetical protein
LGARVAFHDFNAHDYPGVRVFVNRLGITGIISCDGLVDSIRYGKVVIDDVARAKRRLGYCPYPVAWVLTAIQRLSRFTVRALNKLSDIRASH